MRLIILSILITFSASLFSQSLSPEKVAKIKSSTVQIITDSMEGTGFFINSKGTIATCLHVILNALTYKTPIRARNNKGEIIELELPQFTDSGTVYAVAYDLCILTPKNTFTKTVSFLKFGDFNKLQEGQEIYTCGYPFGDTSQFISKGIISTKMARPSTANFPGLSITKMRQELLLDLTSNHGNSGGALMKLNPLSKDDEIIGIIDYTITPLSKKLDSITNVLSQSNWAGISFGTTTDANGQVISGGYNPITTSLLFASFFNTITYGINGAVSVNHLSQLIKEMKK
ncbi:serine protease [Flavobacterium sp.]|uniref:S1 family peptidase n=1 Tax=Flavobacterium sp. TaxID=239 RepID=UPI00374D6268